MIVTARIHQGNGWATRAMEQEHGLLTTYHKALGWLPRAGTVNLFLSSPVYFKQLPHIEADNGHMLHRARIDSDVGDCVGAVLRKKSQRRFDHRLEFISRDAVCEKLRLSVGDQVRVWLEEAE